MVILNRKIPKIKNINNGLPNANFYYKLLRKIKNYKKYIFKKITIYLCKDIIYLGSNYGGWNLLNHKNLENEFIISAGLGEDASFDVELLIKI